MEIDLKTGKVIIGEVVFDPQSSIDIIEVYNEIYDVNLEIDNSPYKSFSIRNLVENEELFNLFVTFENSYVTMIQISYLYPGKDLEDFIHNYLSSIQEKTKTLLRTLVDADNYAADWGKVEYTFDIRSYSVAIVVSYVGSVPSCTF